MQISDNCQFSGHSKRFRVFEQTQYAEAFQGHGPWHERPLQWEWSCCHLINIGRLMSFVSLKQKKSLRDICGESLLYFGMCSGTVGLVFLGNAHHGVEKSLWRENWPHLLPTFLFDFCGSLVFFIEHGCHQHLALSFSSYYHFFILTC